MHLCSISSLCRNETGKGKPFYTAVFTRPNQPCKTRLNLPYLEIKGRRRRNNSGNRRKLARGALTQLFLSSSVFAAKLEKGSRKTNDRESRAPFFNRNNIRDLGLASVFFLAVVLPVLAPLATLTAARVMKAFSNRREKMAEKTLCGVD